jgi:hypothetical protein
LHLTATEVISATRRGTLSAAEYVQTWLEQQGRLAFLDAVIGIDPDRVLAAARRSIGNGPPGGCRRRLKTDPLATAEN